MLKIVVWRVGRSNVGHENVHSRASRKAVIYHFECTYLTDQYNPR